MRRPRTDADWRTVRDLCCRTGRAGDPVEASRWPLFAEVWIGPYQALVPRWTYVAEADGSLVGYLTGCPDTRALRRRELLRVTAPLLCRVAAGRYGFGPDARRLLARALGRRPAVERRLRRALAGRLEQDYPAHLHLNVEAAVRRRGIGRLLVERYVEDLGEAGVAGVHLLCGGAARPFYARLGFQDLAATEARAGVTVHALGQLLRGRRPG